MSLKTTDIPHSEKKRNIANITDAFGNLLDTIQANEDNQDVENFQRILVHKFNKGFSYEFSTGDVTRIQTLLNELRTLIQKNRDLAEDHRQRVLQRLERLQAELHKKMSDIDRFWGLIGDAGVMIGKFGKDAKPIVERIREIADIVWRTQARAEQLPSNTPLPLLEDKKDQKASEK